jgi:uncharacterized protein
VPHAVEVSAFLLVAGVVAGIIGTAGGITSLVAYPALLAVGVSPLTANVTCSVALIGSGASSAARAGPDVAGRESTIRTWLPVAVALSLAGAVVLVCTPDRVFDRVVPFLVAAGATVLLLQPRISRWQAERDHAWGRSTVAAALGGIAFYNGYFGAGSGILVVALLMLTREPVLHRANGMKNVILLVSDLLPALLFAALGTVAWGAAIPLGVGAVVGGLIGPTVARRTPSHVLRVLIACCGFALAGWLLAHP